jgi:adenylate kinase family enzyme
MVVKVFVLGRPGSGKSTAARCLRQIPQRHDWTVVHFNDYDILREMFLADIHHEKFHPTAHNGFDAIDFSVLDHALQELERRILQVNSSVHMVTIEFARDDYREALKNFSPTFLRDAYFLFIDVALETCLHRVRERVERAASADDHPSFSEEIFRSYYGRENKLYMYRRLQKEFKLQKPAKILDNEGSLADFEKIIEQFADDMLEQEVVPLKSVAGAGYLHS